MSEKGKQSPLGVNSLNSQLNVQGLNINPKFVSWAGTSHDFASYRSEEHTSELQSRFGSSYAVFCLKKKKKHTRCVPHVRNIT